MFRRGALLLQSLASSAWTAEPDDWKAEAGLRIEQIRKRDIEVLVVDRLGTPVAAASVTADQIRHQFAFGSCISMNAVNDPSYAAFFTSHFEWAVFENESKWYSNKPSRDFVTHACDDAALRTPRPRSSPWCDEGSGYRPGGDGDRFGDWYHQRDRLSFLRARKHLILQIAGAGLEPALPEGKMG